jgi:hypothetical protein
MPERGPQIPSPFQFGDQLSRGFRKGKSNDFAHLVLSTELVQGHQTAKERPAADRQSRALDKYPKAALQERRLKRQTTVAVSRQSSRHSIRFRLLVDAGLWLRRIPVPPYTAQTIVAVARQTF